MAIHRQVLMTVRTQKQPRLPVLPAFHALPLGAIPSFTSPTWADIGRKDILVLKNLAIKYRQMKSQSEYRTFQVFKIVFVHQMF